MIFELIFNRNSLKLSAGEIKKIIENKLKEIPFTSIKINIISVSVMSKWLIVLAEFPEIKEYPLKLESEWMIDALGGLIIKEFIDYGIRYKHFEIHGKTRSLIYHKEWEKEKYD